MLGGFFFLCRCSKDLVVRSCSVMLTMNFRERESSKFCETDKKWFILALLDMKLVFTTTALVFILSILGLFSGVYLWDDLPLFGAFLLPAGEKDMRCE